jgi:hypothetical protein
MGFKTVELSGRVAGGQTSMFALEMFSLWFWPLQVSWLQPILKGGEQKPSCTVLPRRLGCF